MPDVPRIALPGATSVSSPRLCFMLQPGSQGCQEDELRHQWYENCRFQTCVRLFRYSFGRSILSSSSRSLLLRMC